MEQFEKISRQMGIRYEAWLWLIDRNKLEYLSNGNQGFYLGQGQGQGKAF